MELERYFDFINDKAIRIKDTRVGIETVVRDYLQGASPEEIVFRYPTLTLEQVYATITYYLANQDQVMTYMARVQQHREEGWLAEQRQPSMFVSSLQERLDKQRRQLREQNSLLAAIVSE